MNCGTNDGGWNMRKLIAALAASALVGGLFFGTPGPVLAAGNNIYVGWNDDDTEASSCDDPDFSTDETDEIDINSALDAALAEVDDDLDVIIICNGEYEYEGSMAGHSGDEFHGTVQIEAETPGEVTLDGGGNYQLLSFANTDVFIEGINFINGWSEVGGAIYLDNGSLTVRDSTFEGSVALWGGAIFMDDGSVSIYDSAFYRNGDLGLLEIFPTFGGALVIISGELYLEGTTWTENVAFVGGAISVGSPDAFFNEDYVIDPVSVRVVDSTFTGNFAFRGGAIGSLGADLLVEGSDFGDDSSPDSCANFDGPLQDDGNAAVWEGGAILNIAYQDGGSLDIQGSRFSGNCALDGSGGAVFVVENDDAPASLRVRNSEFINNGATDSGGAIFRGGGPGSSTTITGNRFTNNVAGLDTVEGQGGAVRLSYADQNTTITRNTFTANRADQGGAVSINDGGGDPVAPGAHLWDISRNTFTSNTATVDGGALHLALDNSGRVVPRNITGNRFTANRAPIGGAIVVESQLGNERLILRRYTAALQNNSFTRNVATSNRRTANLGVHFDD